MITKSNAAIFFFSTDASLFSTEEPLYLPMSKLSFTTRHVVLSGSFCEAGLKKFDTAFSGKRQWQHNRRVTLPTSRR